MNTTQKPRKPSPSRFYACHGCGKIHKVGAFTCTCGHKRTGRETLGYQDREDIMLAWKLGKDEKWISQKFNCSNRSACEFKPLSMRRRSYRVMQ